MNRMLCLAAFAALAACSQSETPPAPEATDTAAAAPTPTEAVPVALAADGKPSTGTFRVTGEDGAVWTEVVKADGTFTSTSEGKPDESGRWEQKSPGVYCYTMEKPEPKPQVCNTEQVDDKGVWTSINPDTKKVGTVVRVN